MNTYTTYYIRRKHPLGLLAALLMIVSLIARVVCHAGAEQAGLMVVVVRVLLPIAANLIFALTLLFRGEQQLYVTRVPVVLFGIVYIDRIVHLTVNLPMTAICVLICILQTAVYAATYRGYFKTKLWALLLWLIPPVLFCLDPRFFTTFRGVFGVSPSIVIADTFFTAGVLLTLLATCRMPEWQEGDPYRLRPGDRLYGRLIRNFDPMSRVGGYRMPYRNGASNAMLDKVEISNMEKYIHQKRREGLKHFGITHVIIAAYVRCVAEFPGVNRFFAGQKVFARFDIVVNMMAKKEMELNAPEALIKVHLSPYDTAEQVYRKYDLALQAIRDESDDGFDNVVKLFNLIPGLLLKFVVWCLTVVDYFGFLPQAIVDISPFHGSLFITSMGSLGIPPIVHHLYNFGDVPVFCAFGAKKTVRELDAEGNMVTRKYLEYTMNTDERNVDGHYYASVLKKFKSYLSHPERLDVPPAVVVDDL